MSFGISIAAALAITAFNYESGKDTFGATIFEFFTPYRIYAAQAALGPESYSQRK